jgi:hypothetical protein
VRASQSVLILWTVLIVVLVFVEVAELTHLFTLPIQSAIGDPLAFVSALVFTTILALVGAIFIGVTVTARVLRAQGFTPFEEEMLKMRSEIREIKAAVDRIDQAHAETAEDPATDRPELPRRTSRSSTTEGSGPTASGGSSGTSGSARRSFPTRPRTPRCMPTASSSRAGR